MDREEIEIRFLELLNQGVDPMSDDAIRRAVEADPALGDELSAMGAMVDSLADASRPEGGDAPPSRESIDAIAAAFEEGYQQGRRATVERPVRRGGTGWVQAVAVAATVTAFFAGMVWQRSASSGELATVRQDVRELRQTVAVSLLENQLPTRRMQGLEWTAAIDEPGDELVGALSHALRTDESVTVRLATAETLDRFGGLPSVRHAIVDALLLERDPLVQLQLIDLLIGVRDTETTKALRRLENDPNTDHLVRQRVRWALKETS